MTLSNALIGHTGFVGGNLLAQRRFDQLFNSTNFRDMEGQQFEQLACAGVSAVKWQANKAPERDLRQIQALQEVLATVSCQRFTLISSIDVYPVIGGEDESYDCHQAVNHPYGTNRLAFEDFCSQQFQRCCIIRLPALFGPGLKKNIIYDLLKDNCLDAINPASSFQYYDLANLARDIDIATAADVPLVNFFTEPVASADILARFFPDKVVGQNPAPETHYDLRTQHASLWQKSGPYLYSRQDVLTQMAAFIQSFSQSTTDKG